MPTIDIVVESPTSQSVRARQLSSAFDVPHHTLSRVSFSGNIPHEDRAWNVGLIVGPSGSGKSTILREVFGQSREMKWGMPSVVDDFAPTLSIEQITAACQAVGFNTIPAWLRPFAVLSNGEKFRVELARLLAESDGCGEPIVIDEFTSVVDRQVAQIGSHAAQKYIRRNQLKLVVASCHYDIEAWLQPDWVFEPATMQFRWRSLQRRPELQCEIFRATYDAWREFAVFHYLTADLHRSAKCYVLTVAGRPGAFAGVLYRPHPKTRNLWGVSRLVTLPDFQGLGLAFALVDRLGAAYKAAGKRLRTYPAHNALIRGFDNSSKWTLKRIPGYGRRASVSDGIGWRAGGRPCAVFEYSGEAQDWGI